MGLGYSPSEDSAFSANCIAPSSQILETTEFVIVDLDIENTQWMKNGGYSGADPGFMVRGGRE